MPTFNGKHDWIKSQALYTLYKLQNEGNNRGLSISEWSALSNVSYDYLNCRIPEFYRWGIICRDTKVYKGRAVFAYRLSVEGQKWLYRWVLTVPGRMAILEAKLPKLDSLKVMFM